MKSFPLKLSVAALTAALSFGLHSETTVNEPELSAADFGGSRITITANRRDYLDTDLAMSVHSVEEKDLKLDNGQHPAESLNSLAGVYIDQLAGGQGHKAAIRMPINTSGYYLYLQDNIPLQSAAFFNHNALWWSSFSSGLTRMEVLKGAGTALHGSSAVAATINMLSKPVSSEAETLLGMTLGEDEFTRLQLSRSEKVSRKHGYRLSSSFLNNQGWRDHTASQRSEVHWRHEHEIDPKSRLVTLLVASDLEQEMAADLSKEQFEADASHSGLSDAVLAIDPLRKTRYSRLSSQWDKMDGDYQVSLIPYIRHSTNDYTATWNKNMPMVESSVDTIGLLALTHVEHRANAETSLGLDLELSEGQQYSFQPLDVTSTGWGGDSFLAGEVFYHDTTRYQGISPYLQHTRPLADNWTLSLGARYDRASFDFDNHLGRFGDIGHGNLSLTDRSNEFSHLSPKASLNYHLGESSSLFLRFANSFKLPDAGSLYHLTTKDSADEMASLKPEVSDTYEMGYKANFDTVSFDAAIYYMDVDDGIIQAYKDNGQRYLVNASRVTHKGFELASDWQVSDQLNLTAAYSRSRHILDDYQDLSGNDMMSAPEHIANLRLKYQPGFLSGLTSMLELTSLGDYWMDDANSQKQKGYRLLHWKSFYQVNDHLSVNFRVVNLTDKFYAQTASVRYGRDSYAPGTPRTVYLGLDYQW